MISKICVIIPAYNASGTIKDVIKGALQYIPHVIVADDGSTDNTAGIAADAGAEVVEINRNRGKGHALKLLFKKAFAEGYDAVISIDADGQHDPNEIPSFIHTHEKHTNDIIVGSRMHEKEKIPRAKYNSMLIARFYISFAANQSIEDTQCGFRLYPLSLIKKIVLTTDRYVTETEILIKAGDMQTAIRFVDIRAIYGNNSSHLRPVIDVAAITAYVIFYLTIKWYIEGVFPDRPFTYRQNGIHDMLSQNKIIIYLFQVITVLTAVPFSFLFLIEYTLLSLIIKNNFASVRKLGCGFFKITLASHLLPVVLILAIIEKAGNIAGFKIGMLDSLIEKFYPDLWQY